MFKKNLGCQLMTEPSEFDISYDAGTNHYTYKRLGTRNGRVIGAPITADELLPQLSIGVSDFLVDVVPLESSSSDLLSSSASSMIVTNELALPPSGGHLQEQAVPEAAAAAGASNIEEEVDQGIVYVFFHTELSTVSCLHPQDPPLLTTVMLASRLSTQIQITR